MDLSDEITCPVCNKGSFVAKYEATYIYSYELDSDAPGKENRDEFLPFLFDRRDIKDAKQYVECVNCGSKFPCNFNESDHGVLITILQKAIRSDHASNPEFLG